MDPSLIQFDSAFSVFATPNFTISSTASFSLIPLSILPWIASTILFLRVYHIAIAVVYFHLDENLSSSSTIDGRPVPSPSCHSLHASRTRRVTDLSNG